MPNFLKKASRQTRKVCDDHEEPLAALFIRPGQGEDTKRLGAPGGALSKVGRLADEAETAEDDPVAAMFGRNAVLVITPERLLAFGHGTYSGRVKRLVGEVPLSSIRAMELDAPPPGERGAARLEITFTDGRSVSVTPGSRRRRFVEAFEGVTQPA